MFNIPFSTDNVAVFTSVNTGGRAQAWVKPQGCSMIYVLAIGGGAGGGGGFSGASGTTRGGGGGGGSAGIATLLMPAHFIPDTLFIEVGTGGTGGAAGANGLAGTSSIITSAKHHSTSANNLIIKSSNGNSGVGVAGSGAAAGTGGAAAATGSNTISANIRFGNYSFAAGQAGQAGGVHTGAVGVGITGKANIVTGGCGGGGVGVADTNTDGGSIILTNTVMHPSIIGGTATGNGADGINNFGPPLFFLGGAGGSSNGTGTGGKGGDGGFGSGGAGGGGGVTGGAGGRGGDGLVIIAWY